MGNITSGSCGTGRRTNYNLVMMKEKLNFNKRTTAKRGYIVTHGVERLHGYYVLGLLWRRRIFQKTIFQKKKENGATIIDVNYMEALIYVVLAYLVYLLPSPVKSPNNNCTYKDIPSATTLQEAGIQFETINKDHKFGDIEFTDNGVLKIQNLRLDDHTESLIRNFIAYEQYSEDGNLHCITDYVILMDCLINTSKDVELLCHAGIITNYLGDDEKASKLFNELILHVTYSNRTFRYAQEFNKVNKYCATRMNLLKAKLKRDYFNTPWAPISAFAGFILLVLTVIQTTFSVLSYVSPKS